MTLATYLPKPQQRRVGGGDFPPSPWRISRPEVPKVFTKLDPRCHLDRLGDAGSANNPRLRAAVAAALTGNMTRDTINRAIQRGAVWLGTQLA